MTVFHSWEADKQELETFKFEELTPARIPLFPSVFVDGFRSPFPALCEKEADPLVKNEGTDTLLGGTGGPPFDKSSDNALVDREFVIRRSMVLLLTRK